VGEVLTPRDRAYLDILHQGLVSLLNSARAGRLEFAPVEAEHLHEVPHLSASRPGASTRRLGSTSSAIVIHRVHTRRI
jgi:hypothetical protein